MWIGTPMVIRHQHSEVARSMTTDRRHVAALEITRLRNEIKVQLLEAWRRTT